ncbi:MAG: AsmA family protein [Verrucomicrobia bacterium]|nr:AsmA family protein [Verrucomicrobiota bacterium]
MNTATTSRKLKWLKLAGITFGALLLLLVVAWFVGTSAWCLKSVILPKVSKAAGATITVEDASLSPFSSVSLTGLKVQTTGPEPLVTAKQVLARYSLMDILRGRINVDELTLTDPVVRLVLNADGTSNLDAFTKKPSEPKPSTAGPPPQIDIKKLAIVNATLLYRQTQTNGAVTSAELTGLRLDMADLKNGGSAKLALASALRFSTGITTNLAELAGSLDSKFNLALKDDLQPKQVTGGADLNIVQGTGAFADAAQLAAKLAVDLSLSEITQFALNFSRNGAALGAITASGPFDVRDQEGKLKIAVTGLGNEVLSLVGGRFGIYFGSTKLAADYDIELKNKAQFINTTGSLTASQFSVTRSNLATPVLDVRLSYSLTADLPKTNAILRAFNFNVTQAGRPLITSTLPKQIVLDWSQGAESVGDSALELAVTELNLADWKPFLGSNVTAGAVSGKLLVNVQRAGKQIGFDLTSQLAGLAASYASNRIDRTDLSFSARGQMADFTRITLGDLGLSLAHAGRPVASLKGSGKFDAATQEADFTPTLEASLADAAQLAGLTNFTDGTVRFSGRVTQKNLTPDQPKNPTFDQTVTGTLALANLTCCFASNTLDRFETSMEFNANLKNNVADVRQCRGSLKHAGLPAGGFDLTGNFHLTNQAAELTLKLSDLNQNLLRNFLAAALGERSLDSVSINCSTTARYQPKGGMGAKGSLQIANLLITDPKGLLPKTPISLDLNLDTALSAQGVADIKQFAGTVRAGGQPGGTFAVSGQYDLTNQAGQLALKITDLNQNALRPFLAPALGDRKLESVSISAEANAKYAAKGDSSARASLNVNQLLVIDPTGTVPNKPLSVGFGLDATLAKQVLDLRQFQLDLAPTERAKNQLQLAGKVDMTQSNAYTGHLKLSAESLDFTPYYDMFVSDRATNAPPPAKPAPTTASTEPESEPPAKSLPFRQFTFEAEIGKLFLRELALANFLCKTKLDASKVEVDPFQLLVNGAPVSSRLALNLGVPGWQYDLNFLADKVPLEPAVNSFQPARHGQIGGTASVSTQIKGAGVTGAGLQKNLDGTFEIGATNLNLSLDNVRMPVIKSLVNLIVGIPDMIRNPTAALGNFIGKLTGAGKSSNGWMDEFMKSPINVVSLRAKAGNGVIDFQQASVISAAFDAQARGTLTLAPVLTNSVMLIPVEVSIKRDLADKVGLVPAGTPSNAPYARLPDFVTMKGTLGDPKPDVKYAMLAALALKAGGGVIKNIGGAAVGTVGGILGGLFGTGTPAAAPAAVPAAAPTATTPAVPATTPAAPAPPKVGAPTAPAPTNATPTQPKPIKLPF